MSSAPHAKPFDYLVFIGRFQPLHNGHVHIINEALKRTRKLIIVIGSANVARSPRNPFTYAERRDMILACAARGEIKAAPERLLLRPIGDYPYNDQAWLARAQRLVDEATVLDAPEMPAPRIGLIGHNRDRSSYYLRLFPDWASVDAATQFGLLNSTELRKNYLRAAPRLPDRHLCPSAVSDFLASFMLTDAFKWLLAESKYYAEYMAAWGATPYPVFINCADAVVIQSGHILLIKRARHPGQGLLALPGGHVEPGETFRNAAIRELKEETRIRDGKGEIPPAMLASFIVDAKTRLFDDPYRSERGRVVTQAYLFQLPQRASLFGVRGDDDADCARWFELGRLRSDLFFEDHAAIIREMTGAFID